MFYKVASGLRLMGAPKQKWTQEEEAALKAGVIKHGAGKWRTILTDAEFSSILHLRSNVDLKVAPFKPLPYILLTMVEKCFGSLSACFFFFTYIDGISV